MSKTNYKRLGDYIREVDVRNRDLKVTKLYGVNLQKEFMPSVANIIGTDLSKYKIVSYNQFGCKLMSVERDHKLPISLMKESQPAIMSSAYFVFEVIDENVLNPDYLFMQIKRPEFDRRLWFSTGGDVRGGATWDNLCDMPIIVPSIDQQRKIVAEYNAIQQRIKLNEQLIVKLEETAQAIYRKMFVDGIDKNNLPKGWRMGTLKEIAEIIMGQSPNGESYNENGAGEIFYQGRTDFRYRYPIVRIYTTNPTRMAKCGDILLSVRAPVGDINLAPHNCCIGRGLSALRNKKNYNSFLFYLLKNKKNDFNISNDDGTIFGSITRNDLCELNIVIPQDDFVQEFNNKSKILDRQIKYFDKEIFMLTKLQSLLLAKMGQ